VYTDNNTVKRHLEICYHLIFRIDVSETKEEKIRQAYT